MFLEAGDVRLPRNMIGNGMVHLTRNSSKWGGGGAPPRGVSMELAKISYIVIRKGGGQTFFKNMFS